MQNEKMMNVIVQKINEVHNGEATLQDLVDTYRSFGENKTYDWVQRGYAMCKDILDAGYDFKKNIISCDDEDDIDVTQSDIVYDAKTDSRIYSRLVSIVEGEEITPELLMEKNGLDPNEWICEHFVSNYRCSQKKSDRSKPVLNYQTKITVKPKKRTEITFDDIERYFANKNWNIKPAAPKFKPNNSEDYLEIDLCDSHIGLLSYNLETGEDYDVQIAVERVRNLFDDVVERSRGKKFKGITIATLGDILHVDNINNTTAHGTPQDVEGRITKWYGEALDMMTDCIDKVLQLGCPVQYVYLSGNHDTATGNILAMSLKKVYEKNPNIEFDVRPLPQKAVVYGKTLVGLCHGDQSKKATSTWLLHDYRVEFGETEFAQIHCGHLHSESVKDDKGILVYHLPSTCAASLWEKKQGYSSDRGMMCFVYNENNGLRDIWYNYI